MMNPTKCVAAAVAAVVLIAGISGCQKEGPAERAGKQVDKAVDKAANQMEKAGDKIKDAAQDAKK
jgi:outer membrane murein-binding lipoprotein Lpp